MSGLGLGRFKELRGACVMVPRCRALAVIGAAVWLCGCAVGPDYELPIVGVPKYFGTASLNPAVAGPPAPADFVRWWQALHDRKLSALIDRAVISNPDLEIALARVQAARIQQIVVIGAMLPTVGGSAGIATGSGSDLTKGRVAQSLTSGDNHTGLNGISRIAGFDAGWELDLFGKYQRLLEATRDDAEAQIELRNEVLITVIADVARNYFDIRGLQSRLMIARNDVATSQKTVDVLLTRFDRGLSNELDLTLARRQLATQQARLPALMAEISAAESRLAVLLGTYAADIVGELEQPGKFPRIPDRLRAGVPVDLLRRRPDILAAERNLAAATARIGEATADLFPSVALTAGFGAQGGSKQAGTTPAIHGPIWSFGPGAYWPLLDFGRLDALIDIQEQRTYGSYVNYRKTIIVAVEEVDQAIKQYRYDLAQQKALGVALAASRRAVDLAMERYERGVTDFLNVLDAQRQEYLLEDQNAVAEEVSVLQYVAFYKALGGGWELYDELPPIPAAQPAVIATVRRVLDGWH
jgi:NodT family efflux transporter outer membrane factor (OMF) lipoprotein